MIRNPSHPRRGAVAPMAALLMVVMLGMVAFAIDISWIVAVNMELQNAADASALAASNKLTDNYVLYNLPKQTDDQKAALLNQAMFNARTVAKAVAAKNAAGGVASLALHDQDIQFGFLDDKNEYTPYPDNPNYPNTVRIQVRRDETANTPLQLFFAPVLQSSRNTKFLSSNVLFASTANASANSRINLMRNASASINGGFVSSINPAAQSLAVLLVTLDETIWDAYVTKGVDQNGNQARVDAFGNPTFEIYSLYESKGNFGHLSLDGNNTGNNQTMNWIRHGMSASDIQALHGRSLLPISATNETWNWNGNPGFKASSVMEINSNVGRVYLLPLFKAKDGSTSNYQAGVGQGSNYYYNIRRFVGVRIMPTTKINDEVVIQPAAVTDNNLLFTGVAPLGSSSPTNPVVTTFTSAQISR